MSTTVDKRVVDLTLKNQQFESSAAQTIRTTQQLKEALNFSGVGKGFDEIQKSANDIKFDRLASSIESIENKFSALNIAVMSIFQNLVNKAVNAGINIAKAFTFDPIVSGFNEYEAKLGSIQTILSNTISRQKEASQQEIQAINEEADAAVKKNKELNEEAIDNLQETHAAQDKALQKSFQAQSKAFEKQASEQMKAYEKQASAKLEAFEKETEKEIDTLNKSYQERYDALNEEEQKELENTERIYAAKYEALVDAQNKELHLLENSYEQQTKAYETEIEKQNKTLQTRFDAETKALEKSSKQQLDILESQQKQQLKALEKTQDEENDKVEEKYDKQLKLLKKSAEDQLDVLQDNYDSQLESLEDTYDAQMDAIEDYYDDAYDALEKSQKKETELLESQHDARLDMYHEEYLEKLKVADEDRYNKIKAIDDEIDSIKGLEKAEKAEREEAENRRKLQELEAAVEKAETETEKMRAESKLAEFKAKLAEEEQKKEREARIEELEAKKDGIEDEYKERKEKIDEEYDLKKTNEAEFYKTQKENLEDVHKTEKENLKDQEDSEKKQLKKSIDEQKKLLKDQYDYQKKLINESNDLQEERVKKQREEELKALKEQQQDQKDVLKQQQEDAKELLKEQQQDQKDALKEQQELQKKALKEQQDAQKESIRETYETQKKALEQQQELQRSNLQAQNQNETKQITDSYNTRRTKLEAQQTRELNAIQERRSKEGAALQERIDNEREALQESIEARRDALKDSQDAQMDALNKCQKAELKAMKKRHTQELENIETEKQARIASLNTNAGKTEASNLEDVNEALDELNTYADKTIYSFEDMTRNIGTFTAAGVDLDTSVDAIKGIANLAALSGSNAQQASVAMYQLSQAIASGSVKYQDWISVVNSGMGGKIFQESLKETARAHGIEVDKMIAKEGSFQLSLQHGWLTSEVLLETLSKFTGDLTEDQLKSLGYTEEQIADIINLGNKAVEAATKVRTWSQLIDTTKEALGSGWAQTFEIIFGNFDEATALWTEVSEAVGDVINKQAQARNQLLAGWKEGGGREALIQAVKNVWQALVDLMKPIKESFKDIFPPATSKTLIKLTDKFKDFTSKLKLSEKTSKNLKRTFKGLFSSVKLIGETFSAFLKIISPIGKVIGGIATHFLKATGDVGSFITKIVKATEENKTFGKIAEELRTALDKAFTKIGSVIETILTPIEKFRKKTLNALSDILTNFLSAEKPFERFSSLFDTVSKKVSELWEAVKNFVSTKFGNVDLGFLKVLQDKYRDVKATITENGGIFKIIKDSLAEVTPKIKSFVEQIADFFKKLGTAIVKVVKNKFSVVLDWGESLPEMGAKIIQFFRDLIQNIQDACRTKFKAPDFSFITDFIDNLTGKDKEVSDSVKTASKAIETAAKTFDSKNTDKLKSSTTGLVEYIKGKFEWLKKNLNFDDVTKSIRNLAILIAGTEILRVIEQFRKIEKNVANVIKSIKDVPESLSDMFDQVKDSVAKLSGTRKIDTIADIADIIKTLAVSIGILALSVKMLSDIEDPMALAQSVIGISGLITAIGGMTLILTKYGGDAKVSALALLALSGAVVIVTKAVQKLGELPVNTIIQGGVSALLALAAIGGASWLVGKGGINASAGFALLEMATSLFIVQKAVDKFAHLDTDALKKGGLAAAAAITAMAVAMKAAGGRFKASSGVGIIAMATSLIVLQKAVASFGSMNFFTELVPGLLGLAGGLFELAIAANAMEGSIAGAAALGILAAAMIPLAQAFIMMKEVSFGTIINGLTAFGGALLLMVGATALISPFTGALLSLGAVLAGFGVIVIGISVAMGSLMNALTSLAGMSVAQVAAIVAAFGLLAPGILDVLINLVPKITEFIVKIIEAFCTVMVAKKQYIFETAINLLIAVLDKLNEHAAEIVDKLAQFIITVLDGLKLYAPAIVEKAVELVVQIFNTIAETLNKQEPEVVMGMITGFIRLGLILKACAAMSKMAVPAMKGLAELGVFVVELIAIISLLGALQQLPGVSWLLGEGGKLLESLGLAIGKFFGGIVGGVVKGATSTLPSVGLSLSGFMQNADYFLQHITDVTDSHKSGAANLANIIISLTKASLLDSIVNILSEGGNRYSRLGSELSSFAQTAQPFFDSMKSLGIGGGVAMAGVNSVAEAVMTLTKADVLEGLTAWFTGGQSLQKFAEGLQGLGPAIKVYAEATDGIDGAAVEGSANAVKILADAAESLPNSGGAVAYWTGDNSLSDFGAQLLAFGPNLKAYAKSVEGISSESVEGSANAVKVLSRAAKVVPNSGGKIAEWLGDNKLNDFGAQLVSFGPNLKKYADSVSDISGKKVKASANAAMALSNLANNLPKSGGFLQEFLGEQSLATFGSNIEAFGGNLSVYNDKIKDIKPKAVTASASAAQSLAALANDLPEEKGLFAKIFGGDQSLSTFGSNLESFGGYILNYYNKVKDIPDTTTLTSIGAIATNMIDIATKIQNLEIKKLKTFGGYIENLGSSENSYYYKVVGIDFEKVTQAVDQIIKLAGLTETLQDFDSELFTSFGSAMQALGDAGINGFIDAFDEAYDEAITGINKFVAQMSKGVTDKKDDMSGAGSELGAEVPNGLITGMGSKGKEVNDEILLITGAIVASFEKNLPTTTFEGMGSSATNAIKNGFSSPGKEILSSITTLCGGLVKQFQTGLSTDIFGTIANTQILTGLNNGLNDTLGRFHLNSAVQTVCSGIKTMFNTCLTYEQAKSIGVVFVNGLIFGIDGGGYSVNNTTRILASNAVTTLKNNMTYEKGRNSAVDFVNGIIKGISGGSLYVNGAVQKLASNATTTLNDSWEIHSPSRITYVAGKFFDKGLAQGIDDNAKEVTDAVVDASVEAADKLDDFDGAIEVNGGDSAEVLGDITDEVKEMTDAYGDFDASVDGYFNDFKEVSGGTSAEVGSDCQEMVNSLTDSGEALNSTSSSLDTFNNSVNGSSGNVSDFGTSMTNASTNVQSFDDAIKNNITTLGALSDKLASMVTEFDPLKEAVLALTDTFVLMSGSIANAEQALNNYDKKYSESGYSFESNTKKDSSGYLSFGATDKKTSSSTASTYDTSGYLNYGSGTSNYGSTLFSNNDVIDELASGIGTEVTDAMRQQPPDITLDLSNGEVVSNDSKKKSKLKVKEPKADESSEVGYETKEPAGMGTLSAIKAIAAGFSFDKTTKLTEQTSNEVKATQKAVQQEKEKTDKIQYDISKALNSKTANNQTTVENNNVFHINSTDPKQSAVEVGRILQKQAERSKAVWAS